MLAGGDHLREFALSAEDVEHWAATAAPRDQIVYCRGPRLVRTPGVEAISRLHDEGEVILNWRRVAPGIGEWLATRRAEPERPRPTLPTFLRRAATPDVEKADRTLAVLKRHANLERPCPTNRAIADQAKLRDEHDAAYQLRKLIAARAIRVDTDVQSGFRVVTIAGSGRKTAPFNRRLEAGRDYFTRDGAQSSAGPPKPTGAGL